MILGMVYKNLAYHVITHLCLSIISCRCSGKSNMYPKHVHDTLLGDKYNHTLDPVPKGRHSSKSGGFEKRFSWDVPNHVFARQKVTENLQAKKKHFPKVLRIFSQLSQRIQAEIPGDDTQLPDLRDKTSPPEVEAQGTQECGIVPSLKYHQIPSDTFRYLQIPSDTRLKIVL